MAFLKDFIIGCNHPLDNFGATCEAKATVLASDETAASAHASARGWQSLWVPPGDHPPCLQVGWNHFCPEHVKP